MRAAAQAYLATLPVLPLLHEALERGLEAESQRTPIQSLAKVIPTLAQQFGVTAQTVAPFQAAWAIMYSATCILDHAQDGDPIEPWLADRSPAQQQTIALSLYVLATGMLEQLSAVGVADDRVLATYRLWHAMMLRMASGQLEDLQAHSAASTGLETYQAIASAKTGAALALALGGTAAICTHDQMVIDRLLVAGEIIGMLIQMSDDLCDQHTQRGEAHTFVSAVAAHQHPDTAGQPIDSATFSSFAYQAYRVQIAALLHDLPEGVQRTVLGFADGLFRSTEQ